MSSSIQIQILEKQIFRKPEIFAMPGLRKLGLLELKSQEAMLLSQTKPTLGSMSLMLELPPHSELLALGPKNNKSLITRGLLELVGYRVGSKKRVDKEVVNKLTIQPTVKGLLWIQDSGLEPISPIFLLIDGYLDGSFYEIDGVTGASIFTDTDMVDYIKSVLGSKIGDLFLVRRLVQAVIRSKMAKGEIKKKEEGNRRHREALYSTSAWMDVDQSQLDNNFCSIKQDSSINLGQEQVYSYRYLIAQTL